MYDYVYEKSPIPTFDAGDVILFDSVFGTTQDLIYDLTLPVVPNVQVLSYATALSCSIGRNDYNATSRSVSTFLRP